GTDQQHPGVDELALARLADLGDEHLARVAALLGGGQLGSRLLPSATARGPLGDLALEVDDVRVAELHEPGGGTRRAGANGARQQRGRRSVGNELGDAAGDLVERQQRRADHVPGVPLARLAHVDDLEALVGEPDRFGDIGLAEAAVAHGADPPSFAPASTSASSGQRASAPMTAPWTTL